MLIGFIGTPSCGKSTTSFGLCYHLKKLGFGVELVTEYARRHIIECRINGIVGNGGFEGQTIIYGQDSANALLYRNHSDAITITDGCTINCSFYNDFNHLDLVEEANKYDLLFYIPTEDVPPAPGDANRIQNRAQIMALAAKWEEVIRPLMEKVPHIVELRGYPNFTTDQMVESAYAVIEERFFKKKLAA